MAVAVRSHAVGAHAAATAFTCGKPAGLLAGDLMIAHAMARGAPTSITMPTGFTTIGAEVVQGTAVRSEIAWKIATSADETASSYSFATTTTLGNMAAITAFTGHHTTTPINVSSGTANAATNTTLDTTTITPTVTGTMLVFFASVGDNTGTCSTYSCATNNPATWTEQYDVAGTDLDLAMAYGQYAPASATGQVQCITATIEQAVAHAVCIAPVSTGNTGTFTTTTAPATMVASGTQPIDGVFTANTAPATMVADGTVPVVGDFVTSTAPATMSASGVSSGTPTARTTAQAGNWNVTTTWTGGVVPLSFDRATVNHAVAVSVDAEIGGSVNATTGLTIGTAGTLTINTGITFTIKENVAQQGAGKVIQAAGSNVLFQSSAGVEIKVNIGDTHNGSARWTCNGTSGSRCTITSASGGGNASFNDGTGPWLQGGQMVCTYTDFTRIGTATTPAILTSPTASTATFSLDNCTLTTCGRIDGTYNISGDGNYSITNTTFSGTVDNTTTVDKGPHCLRLQNPNAKTTGTRVLTGNVFDKRTILYGATGFTITGNFFKEALATTFGAGFWASFSDNVIRMTRAEGDAGENSGEDGVNIAGSTLNNYWIHDAVSVINPHFLYIQKYDGNMTIDGDIFEHTGTGNEATANGDGVLLGNVPNPSSVGPPLIRYYGEVKNCIVLPNAAGNTSCTLVTGHGNINSEIRVHHNTCFLGGIQSGLVLQEDYDGHTGLCTDGRNNIFWDTSARGYKIQDSPNNVATSPVDIISAASANYNVGWNFLAGSNGNGYNDFDFSNPPPGVNDLNVNPNFVDSDRDMAKWDQSLGGPGTVANAVTEMAKKNTATFNSAYTIANLVSYVKAGFAPQNQALKNSGSDGTDRGAVAVVTASTNTGAFLQFM